MGLYPAFSVPGPTAPRRTLPHLLGAAALFALPTGAEASENDIIVVTAQKRVQRADVVPISTSVVPGERLAQDGIVSVQKLAEIVPGFTVARSYRGPPVLTLRGVGFNSPNLSASSPVVTYVDEVAYPYPVMGEGVLFDLERVEIAKGPQGTLFGRSTTGGLINHVTRKPTRETEGYVTADLGSFEGYGLEGALSAPLSGTLSARLAFSGQWQDKGWQRSVSRDDRFGKVDRHGARAMIEWRPRDGIDFLLTGNWWRDGSDTQAPQAFLSPTGFPGQTFDPRSAEAADWPGRQLAWGGTLATPAPLDFERDNHLWGVSARGDIALGDTMALTALASFTRFERDEVVDGAGFSIENGILQGLGDIESQSHELRLAGERPGLDWITGLAFSRDEVNDLDRSWVGTSTALQQVRDFAAAYAAGQGASPAEVEEIAFGLRDAESRTRQTVRSFSIFGQGDVDLGSDLTLTLGARYSHDRVSFRGCSADMGDGNLAVTLNAYYAAAAIPASLGPGDCVTFLGDLAAPLFSGGTIPFPSNGEVHDRLTEDGISGRLALAWRPDDDMMVYASLARGTKAGVFPNIEGNLASQYLPATKEKLLAAELGVKARPASWLNVDAAAYYYDYRDKQVFGAVTDILFTTLTRIVNIPRSTVWGLEAAVRADPAPGWRIEGALSHLETRIDEYRGYDDFGTLRDFSGGGFPFSPGWQSSVRAEHRFALSPRWNASAAIAVQYSSGAQADMLGDSRFHLPSWAELDAELSFESADGRTGATLAIDNLTDVYRWDSVQVQTDSFMRYAARPRTWRLSLMRHF